MCFFFFFLSPGRLFQTNRQHVLESERFRPKSLTAREVRGRRPSTGSELARLMEQQLFLLILLPKENSSCILMSPFSEAVPAKEKAG